MNIYEKLQTARVRLLEQGLKKGGQNIFIKFSYFELSDFLPELQRILKELKLATHFEIKGEVAVLKIIDFEKEKENFIEFSCPVVFADNKQSQAIQNLGATITYLRRYLYLIAFEITESDQVDNQPTPEQQKHLNDGKEERNYKEDFLLLYNKKDLTKVSNERLEKLNNLKKEIEKGFLVDNVRLNNACLFLKTLQDKTKINFVDEEVKND